MSHTGDTTARYKIHGFAALVGQAGTATSTRGRGETNSFNALRVTQEAVTVERYAWDDAARDFALATSETFSRSDRGWARVGDKPPPSRPSP
jgi:hypothetical protein